jgi:hypothetical protein
MKRAISSDPQTLRLVLVSALALLLALSGHFA